MTNLTPRNGTDELIIVGGGTRGLGKAITDAYVSHGFHANLFHRYSDCMNTIDREHIHFDLDDKMDLERLPARLNGALLDLRAKKFVIHMITGGGLGVNLGQATHEQVERVFLHNTLLPMIISQEVLTFCNSFADVHIDLFFYSSAVTHSFNGSPFYVAAKSALESFFKSFMKQASPNLSAFLLRLGHVDIAHKYFHNFSEQDPAGFADYLNKAVPAGYFTKPEEVAGFCVHLSANQGMFNGMECDLTGGHSWV
jgi:NAD(P)-dependent dehydrogenase (short-subunit alcohol dehydrogenase family)